MPDRYVDTQGREWTTGPFTGSTKTPLFALYKDGKPSSPLYLTMEEAQDALKHIQEHEQHRLKLKPFIEWRDAKIEARKKARVGTFSKEAREWSKAYDKAHPCPCGV